MCAGTVISGLLAADPGHPHRAYAANLIGSALGCVIALPLLAWIGGEGALLVGAAMGLIACLLFIEMPLAQRFILFVGQPVTALAVVLFAMLLFSELGSLTAPRWRLKWALVALIGLSLLMPLMLRGVFGVALGWPLSVWIGIAVISLAPLGLLRPSPWERSSRLFTVHRPQFTAKSQELFAISYTPCAKADC